MHDCGRSYLQACLLLLIAERPGHGYDLTVRLTPLGLADADGTCTYRALRTLEREGLVTSSWRPSGSGPARRIYRLTEDGHAELATCGEQLRRSQLELTRFLRRLDGIPDLRRRRQEAHS